MQKEMTNRTSLVQNSFRMGLYETRQGEQAPCLAVKSFLRKLITTHCFMGRFPRYSVDPDRPWVDWVPKKERGV